jgi:hypothetical protein
MPEDEGLFPAIEHGDPSASFVWAIHLARLDPSPFDGTLSPREKGTVTSQLRVLAKDALTEWGRNPELLQPVSERLVEWARKEAGGFDSTKSDPPEITARARRFLRYLAGNLMVVAKRDQLLRRQALVAVVALHVLIHLVHPYDPADNWDIDFARGCRAWEKEEADLVWTARFTDSSTDVPGIVRRLRELFLTTIRPIRRTAQAGTEAQAESGGATPGEDPPLDKPATLASAPCGSHVSFEPAAQAEGSGMAELTDVSGTVRMDGAPQHDPGAPPSGDPPDASARIDVSSRPGSVSCTTSAYLGVNLDSHDPEVKALARVIELVHNRGCDVCGRPGQDSAAGCECSTTPVTPLFGATRKAGTDCVDPHGAGKPAEPLFPMPVGAEWRDVRVEFINVETVSITVNETHRICNFAQMGMVNLKNAKPTVQWLLLYSFAKGHGTLDWKSRDASPRNQKRREILARNLQEFFNLSADPIYYDRALKGWRTAFHVQLRE